MTWLGALAMRFTGLRKWARLALIIVVVAALCALLWTCWLSSHDKQVVENDRAKSNAQVLGEAREDDQRAEEKLGEERMNSDVEIERAKKAADSGSDPLADGLRELRRSGKN